LGYRGYVTGDLSPAGSTMVNRLGTATATELRPTAAMVIVPRKLGAAVPAPRREEGVVP